MMMMMTTMSTMVHLTVQIVSNSGAFRTVGRYPHFQAVMTVLTLPSVIDLITIALPYNGPF